jgi:hypothetical protein
VPAEVMASAMVLKELEGLSDRQAADALRCDIRWKVATGLALDHSGVHFTIFTYWRTRMVRSAGSERINEAVAEVINATGVLAGRRHRALDSTLLDDAVATRDTVTQLISAIRRARRLIPDAAAVEVSAHEYDSVAKPVIAWDDPLAKQGLVSGLVNNAIAVIVALDGVELSAAQADALGLLALVAGQDVEPGEGEGTWAWPGGWLLTASSPPSIPRPDTCTRARVSTRRLQGQRRLDPETGLILAAAITPANAPYGAIGVKLLDGEDPGRQVLAGSAYGSGDVRAARRGAGHDQAIKAMPLRPAVPGGFDRDDIFINHAAPHRHLPRQRDGRRESHSS